MKRILLGIICCCALTELFAQTFDKLILKRPYVDCKDVTYNAPSMIYVLYRKGEVDSLYSFLDYWQTKCGDAEYTHVIRMLLDVKTANFDSSAITTELFSSLLLYKEHTRLISYSGYGYGYEVAELHKNLQREIRLIASEIEHTYSIDEALLKDFFSREDVSFEPIKTAAAHESKLKRIYDAEIKNNLALPGFHAAFLTSYYHPFGALDLFGPHAGLGAIFGVKQLRHNLDFVMDIRFGRSANEYSFIYQGDLIRDNRWTSAYLGLEYTYEFYTRKNFSIGISPGVGFNGITAVPADDDGDNSKTLPGLDVNGGLAFKYTFGKNGAYAGLQTRYHWVDHCNPGGTELIGSYLSIRLVVGLVFNYQRDYLLSQLSD